MPEVGDFDVLFATDSIIGDFAPVCRLHGYSSVGLISKQPCQVERRETKMGLPIPHTDILSGGKHSPTITGAL